LRGRGDGGIHTWTPQNRCTINARVGFQLPPLPRDILQSAEVCVTKSDSKLVAYEFRTKSAQSGGLETNGRRERNSGLKRCVTVRRFAREARGYWGFYARSQATGECWSRKGWRREWDSNPRYGFPHTRFPSVRLKPLGHPSWIRRQRSDVRGQIKRQQSTKIASLHLCLSASEV
jgi:hypothetical protein